MGNLPKCCPGSGKKSLLSSHSCRKNWVIQNGNSDGPRRSAHHAGRKKQRHTHGCLEIHRLLLPPWTIAGSSLRYSFTRTGRNVWFRLRMSMISPFRRPNRAPKDIDVAVELSIRYRLDQNTVPCNRRTFHRHLLWSTQHMPASR